MTHPLPGLKLIRGASLKVRLGLGAAVVLAVGWQLAPPPAKAPPPPQERAAPILDAEVQRREPARVFRGVQETGRKALGFAVAFPASSAAGGERTYADFAGAGPPGESAAGFGIVVAGDRVLTHFAAMGGRVATLVLLANGSSAEGHVIAYEPETGLVLLRLDAVSGLTPAPLARSQPVAGELGVAAARIRDREIVAPVFIASTSKDSYTISAASGIVVPGTPVFNIDGEALAIAAGSADVSVAYPIGAALARLGERLSRGQAFPSSIGTVLQPLAGRLAERLGDAGVLVSDLHEGGPGRRAGLLPGDVLVKIGEQQVLRLEDALAAIAAAPAGRALALQVRRGGKLLEIGLEPEATLAAADPPGRERPRNAPTVAALLPGADLAPARVPADARVLRLEGKGPGRDGSFPASALRRGPPWLVYLQTGERRFFAVLDARP